LQENGNRAAARRHMTISARQLHIQSQSMKLHARDVSHR
jgi:hypothetical protein